MQCFSLLILAIASTSYVFSTVITPLGPYYNAENPYVPNVWNYDYSQPFNDCPVCTVAEKCGPYCWVRYTANDYYVNK